MSFKEKRIAVGLTQQAVASALGIHQSAVSLWEQGKTAPRFSVLRKLAALYKCSIDDLAEEGGE